MQIFLKIQSILNVIQLVFCFAFLIWKTDSDTIIKRQVVFMQQSHFKNDNNSKLVGIRIKNKRKEKNLTQETLAELMEISSGQLSCIERGVYLPTTQNIYKICDILGEKPNYYLIGQISTQQENRIIELVKMLPASYQEMVESSIELLVNTFRKEIDD